MSFSDDGHDLYPRTRPKLKPQPTAELDSVTAMQLLGAQEMKAAKRWLHANVNQHRRELGLPVEVDREDFEDLKHAVQVIFRTYVDLTKKVIAALSPILKNLDQDDWTLGR